MKSRRWVIRVIGLYLIMLCLIAVTMVIVDPYFHFHAPIKDMSYTMEPGDDLYMNYGILKNFDYDMLIIGASTTNGFSTSMADELFHRQSARVTFQGEGFKGVNHGLQAAIDTHPDLKVVIRGLDSKFFMANENWMGHDEYPEYLYDDSLWNDVYYIFNGDILCRKTIPAMIRTLKGEPAKSFDFYINQYGEAGSREGVLSTFERSRPMEAAVDEQETKQILADLENNLQKNVIDIIEANPDITFYLFFPPYSILWWDNYNQYGGGRLERRIQLEEYAIDKLLPYDNVRLFSFTSNHEWICDLDNYGDYEHYTSESCAQLMKWMRNGEYELTEENYEEYIDDITEFLQHYDYDAVFE